MKEELNSLSVRVADALIKYIYFMLAMTAASIAYGLSQANEKNLSISIFILFFSLFFWVVSFYSGIRYLNLYRDHLIENANCLINNYSFYETNDALDFFNAKMKNYLKFQQIFFIIGVVLYIFWWFVEKIK